MEPLNAQVDEWEVAVHRVLLQDVIGRGAFGAVWRALLSSPNGQPGNRTVAAKCFTRKPPSICSIIHMLISGVVIKCFIWRERGREGVVQNYFSTNAHPLLLHSKKRRRGRSKQTKEVINQFGRKSGPAIILVSNK